MNINLLEDEMGIDYRAVSGYGIEITESMCEEASTKDIIFEEGDSVVEFVEALCWDTELECEDTGNCYSGHMRYWILISDPLNKDIDKLIKQLNDLPFGLNIKSHTDLVWVSDILVY